MATLRLLAAALLITGPIFAAEDALLPQGLGGRRPACPDMLFQGSRLIMELEARSELDSARAVNASLEKYCGWNEQVLRYRILSDTTPGGFPFLEETGDFFLRKFLQYRKRRLWILAKRPSVDEIGREFGYWADPDFDAFTLKKAESRMDDSPDRDQEIAHCLYAERWDRFESLLKHPQGNSVLNRRALLWLANAHGGFGAAVSIFGGAWIPTGNLERVNEHGLAGLRFGIGEGRTTMQFRLGLIFPNGPYRYDVAFQDSLIRADEFDGTSIALEIGVSVFQTLNWKANLVGGFGGLWAIAYTEKNGKPVEDRDSKDLSSREWTLAVRLDHLWAAGGLWALEAKYFFLDVGNRGATPLDGNAFAVLLHLGFDGKLAWMDAREVWK